MHNTNEDHTVLFSQLIARTAKDIEVKIITNIFLFTQFCMKIFVTLLLLSLKFQIIFTKYMTLIFQTNKKFKTLKQSIPDKTAQLFKTIFCINTESHQIQHKNVCKIINFPNLLKFQILVESLPSEESTPDLQSVAIEQLEGESERAEQALQKTVLEGNTIGNSTNIFSPKQFLSVFRFLRICYFFPT